MMRSLPTPALGVAEITLNRYLSADVRALERCAALAGRALELRLSDFGVRVVLVAERHGMQVRATAEGEPDVCLTGRSAVFGRLLFSGSRDGLTGGGLRIEGDVAVAQRFADLLSGVDFDLTDLVDARFGPVPANLVGRGLRGVRTLVSRAVRELPEQTAEYLREETRDVIGDWEHERFACEVDNLRDGVARLEARIRRLGDRAGR